MVSLSCSMCCLSRLRLFGMAAVLLVAAGCQQQNAQPQIMAPSAAVTAAQTSGRIEQQVKAQETRFADLEQRLTLVQEQLIRANANLAEMQQRTQQQLVVLQQMQLRQQAEQNTASEPSSPMLDQLIALVDRMEQLSTQPAQGQTETVPGPEYALASVYTPQGRWIIFKYDRVTGLTWLAEAGRWKEVEEMAMVATSRYQLVVQAASGDVKGFVAARVDTLSGETWWLNGNRWEAMP